jgi:hypothetical protein
VNGRNESEHPRDQALDVLLVDYQAGRDDDRTNWSGVTTIFSIAIASIALCGTIIVKLCDETLAGCRVEQPWFIVASLMVPAGLLAHLQALGAMATLRSFYLRALEREIALRLGPSSEIGSLNRRMQSPAQMELLQTYYSTSQGLSGYTLLSGIMLISAALGFGTLAILGASVVPVAWRLVIVGIFVPVTIGILGQFVHASRGGRDSFKTAVGAYQTRRIEPLWPRPKKGPDEPGSLFNYLLLPRPNDLAKALFLPVGYVLAIWLADENTRAEFWKLALALVAFELLNYQARYQRNDLVGITQDAAHPEKTLRGRLPLPPGSERRNIRASIVALVLRTYWFVALAWFLEPPQRVWLLAGGATVWALASVYDTVRSRTQTMHPRMTALLIIVLVGIGYAVRVTTGMGLVTDSIPAPVLAAVAFLTWSYGVQSVVLAWTIEANAHVRAHGDNSAALADRAVGEKHHLRLCLDSLYQRVELVDRDETQRDGYRYLSDGEMKSAVPLGKPTSVSSPWVIASGLVGLAGIGLPAILDGFTWRIPLVAAIGLIEAALLSKLRLRGRLIITGIATVTISALFLGEGAALMMISPIAALILGSAYTSFGRMSYADVQGLSNTFRTLPRAISRLVIRVFLGRESSKAYWEFPPS